MNTAGHWPAGTDYGLPEIGAHGSPIDLIALCRGIVGQYTRCNPCRRNEALLTWRLSAQYSQRSVRIIVITTTSGLFQTDGTVLLYGGNHDTIKPSFTYDGSNGVTHHLVSDDYCHEALGSGVGVGAALWPRRDVFSVLARRSVRSSSCEGHHPAAPGRHYPFGRSSCARRSVIRPANRVARTTVRSAFRDWTGCASAASAAQCRRPCGLDRRQAITGERGIQHSCDVQIEAGRVHLRRARGDNESSLLRVQQRGCLQLNLSLLLVRQPRGSPHD